MSTFAARMQPLHRINSAYSSAAAAVLDVLFLSMSFTQKIEIS